jgi:1,4-alpha-glucan branching enzyme
MTHLAELLAAWLPEQRWFAGAGAAVLEVTITSDVVLTAGEPELRHLVADVSTDGERVTYQVLVGVRAAVPPELAPATIGTLADDRIAYDAMADAELTRQLVGRIATGRGAGPLSFAAVPGAVVEPAERARPLPAAASNTSVVFGERTILKVLRRPFEGHHPDLEIPAALTARGSTLVAAPLGWIDMPAQTGPQEAGPREAAAPADATAPTTLAILSEYLPNSCDGWSLATASLDCARTGVQPPAAPLWARPDVTARPDFTEQAHELGLATARLHAELAAAFGTRALSRAELATLAGAMTADLARAVAVVPGLGPHAASIQACYDRLAGQRGQVIVQRIHGDYHLAQVLATDQGWVVLDFEGEPSVPLARRRDFAPALRDVAGMLRSFDYAARHQALRQPQDRRLAAVATEWVSRCQDAFCVGYARASGTDPREHDPLLRALILSKAVYEAVYEAKHRPGWLSIPLDALAEATRMTEPEDTMSEREDTDDTISHQEIEAIVAGRHHDPHGVLGAHQSPRGTTIRALRPLARSVAVVLADGTRFEMAHKHEGVFCVTLPADAVPASTAGDYRLAVRYAADGDELLTSDPYRYLPTLGEMDLHLIAEGRHEELWRVLGARVRPDLGGTSFAVWAPSALGVRVTGDFNHWDGRGHPMRSLGSSGVWELFVPDVGTGARYKYEICGQDGTWYSKADPMAAFAEVPPATASVVFESGYRWSDGDWMAARERRDPLRGPMSVYEVHIGSWRPGLSYAQLAEDLVRYVLDRGFTHVEFMPVAEHPFGGSWGYQVTSYYAPSARFGTPDDFRYLVDRLHQAGIGVFIDWVPAHFPKDSWALAGFDGTQMYEHSDPLRGEHPDWGTLIFDFGRREVRNFLVANAVYWLEEFHIDGLRVDAVASMLYLDYSRGPGQWTPNVLGGRENLDAVSFLQEVNATCYKRSPGIVMIAEESTAWPGVTRPVHLGGLGFGLKWNMGWMHDTLAYLTRDPLFRRYHHNELTFSMIYAYTENFVLPLSHDEVVHGKGSLLGKMPGDDWKKFATLRALFGYMWAHPGKQLLFMGSEFGQRDEWSEQIGLDWAALEAGADAQAAGEWSPHLGLRRLVDDLNAVYRRLPTLWLDDFSPAGFSWIDANDALGNVISFLRFAPKVPDAPDAPDGSLSTAALACVVNFSGDPHYDYRVGLPFAGRWREVINSDALDYGGSGVGNWGAVEAAAEAWHGRPASAVLTLPPLGVLWLVHDEAQEDAGHGRAGAGAGAGAGARADADADAAAAAAAADQRP